MYSLGIVGDAFLGIILTLDTWIYSLISSAYKIFMAIASARLLSSDAYTEIANKVYIIIGVGMLFVLAYAILRAIIDPDQLSKGDMAGGKVLKSVAKAVIGLIITPFLFTLAYNVQSKVLEESILSKLFFRTSDSVVEVEGVGSVNYDEMISSTGGAVTATSVWQAFFYPADGVDPNEIEADAEIVRQTANLAAAGCAASVGVAAVGLIAGFFTGGAAWVVSGAAVLSCVNAVIQDGNADKVEDAVGSDGKFTLTEAYAMVSSGESFAIFQAFLEPISDGDIKYTWFISTVFGAFVAYAFVTYAIDMGVRAAKLAYYQIIAPIPLILQILPKSGDKLDKFVKEVLKTFLDVFVRISIVYIIVYMICHLSELFSTVGALWNNNELSGTETLIAKALLIIGLVLFAKQAPKMIGDTFGLNTGGALDGLNLMKKLREGEVFTAGSVVGGTLRSGIQNGVGNFNNKTKRVKDKTTGEWIEKKRSMGERLVGGVGSGLWYGARGGVNASRDRMKSGKPVNGIAEAHNESKKTAAQMKEKSQYWDDFFRINDTTGKQLKAARGAVKSAVNSYVFGEENTGSIDRQSAAYDYMKDMAGKLEGTVGNDEQIKAANRWVNDMAMMNANEALANAIQTRHNRHMSVDDIADELKIDKSLVTKIITGGKDAITADDINAARSGADERLKIAKKDAVSRKLAEAYLTGSENDTSRMAKQLLSSREFLRYADEFDQLDFDGDVTFGDFLRKNFGENVTKDGTIDFSDMFKQQVNNPKINGSPKINLVLEKGSLNATDAAKLGIPSGRNVEDYTFDFDLANNQVIITDTVTGRSTSTSVSNFKSTSAKIAESYTVDASGNRKPSKKTIFARAKDQGETGGDKFRDTDLYKDRQARKREAEKKDKK